MLQSLRVLQYTLFACVLWVGFTQGPLYLTPWVQHFAKADSTLWLDEALTVPPALSVYREGYLGFRCVSPPRYWCYGGTLAHIDGQILRHLPSTWLLEDPVVQAPGYPSQLNVPYPNQGRALRWFRIGLALCALLTLVYAAWQVSPTLGVAVFVAFPAASQFMAGWNGIKNDFANQLGLFAFYAACAWAIGLETFKQRRRAYRVLMALSIVVGFIKLQGLGITLTGLAVLGASELLRKTSFRALIAEVLPLGLIAGITALALHPSFWRNSLEVRWVYQLTMEGLNPIRLLHASPEEKAQELLLSLQSFWPLALAFFLWITRDRKLHSGILFTLVAVGLFASARSNFTGLYNRPHYYLPIFAGSLWLLLRLSRKETPMVRALVSVCVMAGLLITFAAQGGHIFQAPRTETWSLLRETAIQRRTDRSRFDVAAGTRVLLDINARWPVPRSLESDGIIVEYFDSLAQTPLEVAALLRSPSDVVVAPCWGIPDKDRTVDYIENPRIEPWVPVSNLLCAKERSHYGFRTLAAQFNGHSASEAKIISGKIFKAAALKGGMPGELVSLPEKRFSTRILRESHFGADDMESYGETQLYDRSLVLYNDYATPKQGSKQAYKYEFQVASSCRTFPSLSAQDPIGRYWVEARAITGGTVTRSRLDLDTSDAFCKYYEPRYRFGVCSHPPILRAFSSWTSSKAFPVGKIELVISPPKSAGSSGRGNGAQITRVEIETHIPEGSGCRVYLTAGKRK